MSTNLPEVQTARNSLGRIAQAARSRAQEVQEALAHLDTAEENVRIGAAAVLQDIDNERDPLTEEGEQLLNILSAGRSQQAQASQPVPAEPLPVPVIVEQTAPPAPEPVTPATEQEDAVIEQQQTAPEPVTPATERVPAIHHPEWGKGARIGAIIGFIVSILIAVNSREWVADLADLTTGFGAWILKAAWILALPAFGYYAVGYIISSVIDRTRSSNPQQA